MIYINVLEGCPYCERALYLLETYKLKYNKTIVKPEDKTKFKTKFKINSFPQIYLNKTKLGGCSDLENYINTINEIKSNNLNIQILYKLFKEL